MGTIHQDLKSLKVDTPGCYFCGDMGLHGHLCRACGKRWHCGLKGETHRLTCANLKCRAVADHPALKCWQLLGEWPSTVVRPAKVGRILGL
jgi:hypothetical protein